MRSDRLGGYTDVLATGLTSHLKHEEDQTPPLIQAFVTPQRWARFGQVHAQRIGPQAPYLLPWLLDGADEQTVGTMLAPLPDPARTAYSNQWLPTSLPWTVGLSALGERGGLAQVMAALHGRSSSRFGAHRYRFRAQGPSLCSHSGQGSAERGGREQEPKCSLPSR
jgi:hypothetical protein